MENKQKLLCINIKTHGEKSARRGGRHYKSIGQEIDHDLRLEEMDDDYLLNPELTHLEILEGNKEDILNEIDKRSEIIRNKYLEKYRRKLPSNWKPVNSVLLTFGDTMQDDIKKYGRERMLAATKEFLSVEYGHEPLMATLHMDETTPHMHLLMMNWNEGKQKAYSTAMQVEIKKDGGSSALQDRYADWMKDHIKDWDYVRGLKKVNVKEYHNQRHKQEAHLKAQKAKVGELEVELSEAKDKLKTVQTKLEQKQDEFNNLYLNMAVEKKKIADEHMKDFKTIVDELEALANTSLAEDFIKLYTRYIKSDNTTRLSKLIQKYNGKIGKIVAASPAKQAAIDEHKKRIKKGGYDM